MAKADRAARVLVGTSGFSYPAWRGTFYPADLKPGDMLSHYGTIFETVEINYTFRRFPSEALLKSWHRQTPGGFRFVLKAPQRITHQKRLKDVGEPTNDFLTRAALLGTKRGPVLFQLPPHLRLDLERLDAFLGDVPKGTTPVMEFRHESWFTDDTYALLRRRGATLCVGDADDLPMAVVATAPVGYLRLRRDDYDDVALGEWASRIRAEPRWKRVFVFFKHDEAGRAGLLGRRLLELIAEVS